MDITLPDDGKLNAWVVYPERQDKAGVVLVIHDIRGLSDWIRAVGDQLAQDGFIAVVPDFLSGKGPEGGGTASLGREVGQTIRRLTGEEVAVRLNAAMAYGASLPASNGKTGVLGFCWGGTESFRYAIMQPKLAASVVFYGNVPDSTATEVPEERIAEIQARLVEAKTSQAQLSPMDIEHASDLVAKMMDKDQAFEDIEIEDIEVEAGCVEVCLD